MGSRVGNCSFALGSFIKATGANHSRHSDVLFMKEWFSLFKSDSLQICSFHNAFPLFMPKTIERIALHCSSRSLQKTTFSPITLSKIETRANRSLQKKWKKRFALVKKQVTLLVQKKPIRMIKPKSEFPTLKKSQILLFQCS